jgi:hypothetical protein
MRKGIVLFSLIVFLAIGAGVQANVLQNPGFEEGNAWIPLNAIPGWLNWGGSGGVTNEAGRTIDTQALLMWWTDSGLYQDFPVTAGHTYRFEGYMMHPANDALRNGDKTGEIHAEWYNPEALKLGEEVVGIISKTDATGVWFSYSKDLTAPQNAVTGRYLLRMYQPTAGDGIALYDNVSVYDAALHGQAYDPTPADGASVDLSLDDLLWSNRSPTNPADTFTCEVYFESEGILAVPGVYDPNFTSAEPLIASGVTTGTVSLAAEGITLLDGYTYTWRVDSTDPNTGGIPVTTPGVVWSFTVSDVPPTVDPDVNDDLDMQYTWVDETDNDANSATVSFMLSGSYTDDGKSPIIRAVYEQGAHEKAGGSVVVIGTQTWTPAPNGLSGTVTAPVTITNSAGGQTANGAYSFWLNVEDSAGNSAEEARVIVYLTCIEAATGDPDDPMYQQWINGDLDGDCDTDLSDFAILAESWVDCMTPKAGCTP